MTTAAVLFVLAQSTDGGWTDLFNGRDLSGWKAKIVGHKFGDNFAKTFLVKDKCIVVSYAGYGGEFKNRFGHLFYKKLFKNYIFRMEYRFLGEQLPDGPGWAWRNSGIMFHCQYPKSMKVEQDFPVSAEYQLLGARGNETRSTGNLCTPGTNVVIDDRLVTQHCTDSKSDTFPGDQWVKAELEVHGSGKVVHRINGVDVMTYEQVQLDPNDKDAKPLILTSGLLINEGYIALQSESHPCEFRNIQIKELGD